MAEIVLVTGGSRSGKSSYALQLAQISRPPRIYIATCPVEDDEMHRRVLRHQEEREAMQWETIEETVDVAGVLDGAYNYNVVLIDCLTLWVSNLLLDVESAGNEMTEDDIELECLRLVKTCREFIDGLVILVTNEVGWGIVPESPLARRYRDLAGRCNQTVAAEADAAVLLVSGIPVTLKDDGVLSAYKPDESP